MLQPMQYRLYDSGGCCTWEKSDQPRYQNHSVDAPLN